MSKQIRTHTMEHGRVYAQVEQFGGVAHLALQPVQGGAAHRLPLDDPELEQLLEDYPDLRQVLEEDVPEPQAAETPAEVPEEKRHRPERAAKGA